MNIKVRVNGQNAIWYDKPPRVADNSIQFVKFYFDLSEDWDECTVSAQFTQGENTYNRLLVENLCSLPEELVAGKCQVSLFGYRHGEVYRATLIPLDFNVYHSGFVPSVNTPVPPTPDLYAQLLEQLYEVAILARYYIISAEQISEEYVQFSFTPSQQGMPEVPSKTIKLYRGPEGPEGSHVVGIERGETIGNITTFIIKMSDGEQFPFEVATEKGDPGYTPKKGVDYYTAEEEKAFFDRILELVNPILQQANQAISDANDKANLANQAAADAITATQSASDAAVNANNSAQTANNAASDANKAASRADTAASGAVASTQEAVNAADLANQAADSAIGAANAAAQAASEATTAANAANDKASIADTAASAASTAASNANTAASNADKATTAANQAASLANTAANSATSAASEATTAANAANDKASIADTAASAASTAASNANTAASNADKATTAANQAASLANTAANSATSAASEATTAATGANQAKNSAETAAQTANTAAAAAQKVVDSIVPDVSKLKDDLSNKLPKSPANWEAWTAEEQAAARERMNAQGSYKHIATITIDEDGVYNVGIGRDENGMVFSVSDVYIYGYMKKTGGNDATVVAINTITTQVNGSSNIIKLPYSYKSDGAQFELNIKKSKYWRAYAVSSIGVGDPNINSSTGYTSVSHRGASNVRNNEWETLTALAFATNGTAFGVGTTFDIWGR